MGLSIEVDITVVLLNEVLHLINHLILCFQLQVQLLYFTLHVCNKAGVFELAVGLLGYDDVVGVEGVELALLVFVELHEHLVFFGEVL